MPHGGEAGKGRNFATRRALAEDSHPARSIRSAILGRNHAANLPIGGASARAWPPLGAILSRCRPLEERRTFETGSAARAAAFGLIGQLGRSNMTVLSLGGARRFRSGGKEEGQ